MNADASGLWWTLAILDGAVGSGILIYGIRQREWRSLACGLILNILPMAFIGDGALLGMNVAVFAAYVMAFNFS